MRTYEALAEIERLKEQLAEANARAERLGKALAGLLSAQDYRESLKHMTTHLPEIAEWCWEEARQALSPDPQESESQP